jgi:hypothetical protein
MKNGDLKIEDFGGWRGIPAGHPETFATCSFFKGLVLSHKRPPNNSILLPS